MTIRKVPWFFDVISPFSYLGLRQLSQLPQNVTIEFVPVLFAGLLKHYGQVGNAEIASKRKFTYQFALWRARKMGIAMRMPPTHPFNPLMALRLIIAAGNSYRAVELVFEAVFLHGRDVSDPGVIAALAGELGITQPEAALGSPDVKRQLHENTARAISLGVFGVPTFAIDGEIFWGHDAFEMALDFIRDPEQFMDPQMRAAESLPVGVVRPRK